MNNEMHTKNNFRSFLEEKCCIPDKRVSFFLYWITQYHKFNKSSTLPDTERVKAFLRVLARKYEEWQVNQAKRAISLYSYYANRDLTSPSEMPSDWHTVRDEVVRLLRLRHRSYRTEKTYLGWLRRFAAFLDCKSSKDVSRTDLSNYLSYLSVERKVSPRW